MELRLGDFVPRAPVVLAPMAGVTNAPFRALCRRFGPGLVYVNEMVMATALVHGNAKTERMVTFDPDEHPRSLQVYGSDPAMMGRAVDRVCDRGLVDHIDLNFGCPAAKVTRKGGGAAVPAKPRLLRAIVRAAVTAAAPYGVPVTAKFRIGLHDGLITHLRAGEICADEGVVAIAVHARTVQQHYAGDARWDAIAELKAHVTSIPVLGNGDIWEAVDAVDDDARHRLRRRRRRARLPRAAVAVRRPPRGPRRPPGAAVAPARRGGGGDGRPRRGARRPPRRRVAWRCAPSASTPRGTSPATRSAARPAAASPRSRRWPSSTTSSPRSIRR